MFVQGRIVDFIFLCITSFGILYFLNRASKGNIPKIRQLAAVDAMEEAVGRATEIGKPVLLVTGWWTKATGGLLTLVSTSMLSRLARYCATLGPRLLTSSPHADMYVLVQETVRQAYLAEGNPKGYNEEDLHYFPDKSYATATMALMERERPSGIIYAGGYSHEAVQLSTLGASLQAIQIGACGLNQISFFAASCDYILLGEELYGAAAYLTQDPAQLGTLAGQDYVKMFFLLILIIGVIITGLLNSSIFVDILNM